MSTLHAHVMKDGVGLRIWESSQVVEWTKHHSCPFMYSTDVLTCQSGHRGSRVGSRQAGRKLLVHFFLAPCHSCVHMGGALEMASDQ